jgi:polar amino acid transport system permease protein
MLSTTTAQLPPFAHLGETAPTVRARSHYRQWIAVAGLLVAGMGIAYSLYSNKNLDVSAIRQYLFDPTILRGVVVTLELTTVCFAIGFAGGLLLAIMRLSPNRVLSTMAAIYVWVFRSVPPLVQLIFWGFFAALYPTLKFGVPFTGITFVSATTNSVMSPLIAAIVGLSLVEMAYTCEVIRGGIAAVDHGQSLAARSLGMGRLLTLRKVILPQAMPAMVPPLGNNLIDLLKGTSLVSVIGGAELMTSVQHIYSQNFNVIPMLCVAAIWYLAITAVISLLQSMAERHYGKSRRQRTEQRAAIPDLTAS